MAENLSSLSGEDIAKLEKTISQANDLITRQEEIIKKVLAGEKKIGEARISYLNEYFDIYSRNLDTIIARKTSKLSDAFLILDRQSRENFAAATSELEETRNKQKSSRSSSGGGNNNSGGGNNNGGGSQNNNSNNEITVYQTISHEQAEALGAPNDADIKNFADKLAKFFQQTEEARRNVIISEQAYLKTIDDQRQEQKMAQLKNHAQQTKDIEKSILDLEILRYQEEEDRINQVTGVRLERLQESLTAEISAQKTINEITSKLTYSGSEVLSYGKNGQEITEAGETRARETEAKDKLKYAKAFEDNIIKYRTRRELEAKRKNNGILSKEDASRIEREIANKFTLEKLNDKKLIEARAKLEAEQASRAAREEMSQGISALTERGKSFAERKEAWRMMTHDESGEKDNWKLLSAAIVSVSDLAKQLDKKIDDIASYKGFIDTRLQGSNNEKSSGSYWNQLTKDMMSVGAVNPYFKQETFANNIKDLVNRGISFDLKQRAFLMTIQEKIANTFDVADGTLLRLIRIQQEDSTAGRLGMESALNSFLNNMYETSEYLTQVADGVRGSLEEMQALMEGAEATEVEYQVQKWLGSLYSVGMSQNAVNSISTALGQIAAGQIEGLTNGGAGNLLVMAANDAGLSIADILTDGLDASDTNKLLQASVNYLAELAEASKDNKVVQQQLANVFGVKASDLKAATNLAMPGTLSSVYGSSMTYGNMLNQLYTMAGSMGSRTSMAEMMTNLWNNGQYTLASSMANNPVSYFIYKMATVLDDTAGGIAIPAINIMGNMVDLETTVADLMRVAAVGTGILGSLGPIVSGLGNSFSGQRMLNSLGIKSGSGLTVTPRGDGSGLKLTSGGNRSVSDSGYVGNASGSDVKDSTLQESKDSKKQQMIEAKEEAEANQVDILNTTVLKIYELLDDVARGNSSLTVKVEGYGLTRAGSGGINGGVSALNNLSNSNFGGRGSGAAGGAGSSSSGNHSFSGGTVNSSGVSGSIDFGGWTTTV